MVYPSIMEPKVVVVMEEYAQITKWGFCNTIGKVGVKKNQKKTSLEKKKDILQSWFGCFEKWVIKVDSLETKVVSGLRN